MGRATRPAQSRRQLGHSEGQGAPASKTPSSANRQPERARAHLGRGLLAAVLLHVHLLAPLLSATFIYAAREEAQRPDEVDVAFEDVRPEELPSDLPPLDDTPAPTEKLAKHKLKADPRDQVTPKKPEEVRKPDPKIAQETPPPREPDVPVPPVAPTPTPVQPPPPKLHEKIVDLDNEKDVEAPPDAKYLAQKNNRAEVETRATQTNMEREQKGEEGSQKPEGERRDDKEIGDDRAKIAQLDEQKSLLGRAAPDVTPEKEAQQPERSDKQSPRESSLVLSLRDPTPRGHEITPETADPSLPHDPAGMLAKPRPRGIAHDHQEDHHHHTVNKRLKLALSGKDYEYLFGKEAMADRQLAEKERSTRVGKHVRGAARVRSALENFINEVKPGNQTALNTRAAPFAVFIARMHRNIHQLWGFGALENWDELPPSSPLNDESLMTKVEIELNKDGTVNKVSMVRPSKYLPFDAAAVDVVLNAGPYPEPPREIRSANGKIYVHWSFFRDGRQCATSGVDYFILNNAPKGGDGTGSSDMTAPEDLKTPALAAATPGANAAGPRRLERRMGEANERRLVAESVPGDGNETAPGAAAPTPPGMEAPGQPQDKATVDFARAWFGAYVRGDIRAMTERSSFPFRSAAGVVAKSRGELADMLSNSVAETAHRLPAHVTVETAAGLRKLIGKLPPGVDDGSGTLFAVTRVDADVMILLMGKTNGAWRATGLIRR